MISRLSLYVLSCIAVIASSAAAQIGDSEFRARRDSLIARLPPNAVVVAFGERDEIGFPAFYQSPNFRYLTGLSEPNAILVIAGRDRGGHAQGVLFRQDRSPSDVLFNGVLEEATALTRRTELAVLPLAQFAGAIDSLVTAGRPLFMVRDTRSYGGVTDTLTRGYVFASTLRRRLPSATIQSADAEILALRARKSETEQVLIHKSAEITSQSVNDAIRSIRPGQHEYHVQAMIESGFRSRGADAHPGFATNVSAGMNSTTAHHRAAEAVLEGGAMVLMDVGAAYQGYAADLTRTVPVNGTFSPAQRDIYQLVRDAQASAERAATLGAPGGAMGDSAAVTIARGLARLGLIESADAMFDPPWADRCVRNPGPCRQSYFYYFHGVGHGIGLDVHDPAQFANGAPDSRVVKQGDAFTIEPGIYIDARRLELLPDTPKNRAFIAKARAALTKYDGIGVRIEDDYLAKPGGPERITSAAREIAEIESLMQSVRP
ncbi:MAG: aminopeptidase P N-terminal domain-containing protein [bacterium]